ncbi:MAG: hypothetical protein GY928_36595 [Colwellia sp.]|nr:hypothetical protein [Colwellia sp.]
MTRDEVLDLVTTKDQTVILIDALLAKLGYAELSKEEQAALIESRKVPEFKNQPRVENVQDMYRRKMNEAESFQAKKGYAELIRDYSVRQLMIDMYLSEGKRWILRKK